jgi:predicted TIM-barrel fold metal-dependent hydrolase
MIIDADTHVLPQDAFDYIEDGRLNDLRPRCWFTPDGLYERMEFPGDVHVSGTSPMPPPGTGARYKGASNIEERLNDYRKMGIDRQVLFPQLSTLRLNYALDADLATAMAHSYNISVLNLVRKYPNELIGGVVVALQDVDGAIREIEWAAKEGIRAVILDKVFPVREHCYGETLGSHRELWPFFRRCEELDMPVCLHNISHGHRISNLMRFQMDGMELFAAPDGHMSLMSLITSGLLDDFPKLNIVFTEAGTAFIKPLLKRFDAAFAEPPIDYDDEEATPRYQRRIDMLNGRRITPVEVYRAKNKRAPTEYFKNNILFTIETEEEELTEAIGLIGASQFLFATDYPHDDPGGRMKFKDVELLRQHTGISDADKELIFCGNAKRILGEAAV